MIQPNCLTIQSSGGFFSRIVGLVADFFAVVNRRPDYNAEARFLEYIETNHRIIDRICRSFANCKEDFDDLRQDVLANIWNGLQSYRSEATVSTWIYRITLNTCVSTIRRRPKNVVFIAPEKAGEVPMPKESRFEESQRLASLLASLSLIDHSIMVMWLEDLPYDEIARIMGMNKNSVATRIHRSKIQLKTLLKSSNF